MPEGCSRGCSIRSGPETVRQSPCMAPGSLIIRLHSRLLRHARTANGSFCAPSACQGLPIVRGSRSSQVHFRLRQTSDCRPSWTSIRLVWTAQRRSIAILKAAVSALSTPGPAPAYPPPHSRARNTKKSTAFSGRFRTDAAERGSVGYAVAWRSSRQDRKRSTAFALKQLTPITTAPGALGYKSAPSRESGLPPSLPASPAVTDSMAPLTTRAPTENKLAACASSARHLRSAPLAPLTQPGKRQ